MNIKWYYLLPILLSHPNTAHTQFGILYLNSTTENNTCAPNFATQNEYLQPPPNTTFPCFQELIIRNYTLIVILIILPICAVIWTFSAIFKGALQHEGNGWLVTFKFILLNNLIWSGSMFAYYLYAYLGGTIIDDPFMFMLLIISRYVSRNLGLLMIVNFYAQSMVAVDDDLVNNVWVVTIVSYWCFSAISIFIAVLFRFDREHYFIYYECNILTDFLLLFSCFSFCLYVVMRSYKAIKQAGGLKKSLKRKLLAIMGLLVLGLCGCLLMVGFLFAPLFFEYLQYLMNVGMHVGVLVFYVFVLKIPEQKTSNGLFL
eukprot:TRINITY_DN1859_c0_g1_i2.p1 TRINITY_DN1859_c0_g1~~TRINITY_DN1859_c0_g1_i2.p1  ORF type:complete len:315 (+),score=-5.35 TRINITY_DN1859_c0_g1_i2:155-1099(+)